jgi:transposase
VIDRFHIAKLYRNVVDNVRKQEMRKLKKALSDKEYAELKGVMWIVRKSDANLSQKEKEILDRLFTYSAKLKEVYESSKELTAIFDSETSRNGGIRRLKNWIKRVNESGITAFKTFIATLEKRTKEIANYFISRENSGFVEGINNRIKVLKRRCYGIVDRVHLFRRISLDIGNSHPLPVQIHG